MTIKDKIQSIIERTVLLEVKRSAEAANMPQGFIDNIKLIKESDSKYVIKNDWNKDGVPLALFFEWGTRDHWIEPRTAQVLAWPSSGPDSGSKKAIYSKRHDNKKGNMLFSKGHYVKGIDRYESMSRGFDIGIDKMKHELERLK